MSEEPYVDYMTKQFTNRTNPDYVDLYVVPDDEPITWIELMLAIDDMGWFIDEEKPLIRKGAQWILWWVVRKLKVRIMQKKGLLKEQIKAAKRKKKLTPSV